MVDQSWKIAIMKDGWDAYTVGNGPKDSPYSPRTLEYRYWGDGWVEASCGRPRPGEGS